MSIKANRVLRAVAYAGLFLSAQAAAQVRTEFVGGWEGSSSRGYAFASPVFSVPSDGRWSWIARASVSYLYYEFPEAGATTRVRSPGQSLGVGLRYSGPRLTAAFGPGYEVRQTTRSSTAFGEVKETERGMTAQGEMFFQATPRTNLSALLSYGKANEYFWSRVGLKRQLTNFDSSGPTSLHLGIELTTQGNDDGDSDQVGGVFEVAFPRSQASLQFRSGYQRITNPDGSEESNPYFGVGLYRGF